MLTMLNGLCNLNKKQPLIPVKMPNTIRITAYTHIYDVSCIAITSIFMNGDCFGGARTCFYEFVGGVCFFYYLFI